MVSKTKFHKLHAAFIGAGALILLAGAPLAFARGHSGGSSLVAFQAVGSGTATSTNPCLPDTDAVCTATFSGSLRGEHIGNSTVSADISVQHLTANAIPNGQTGEFCFPASGTGTITAADGSTMNLAEVGLLCDVPPATGSSLEPQTFSGSYYIEGGTKRFANAVGSGQTTASDDGNTTPTVIFSLSGALGGFGGGDDHHS